MAHLVDQRDQRLRPYTRYDGAEPLPVDPEDGVDAARIAAAGRLDAIRSDEFGLPANVAPVRGPARTPSLTRRLMGGMDRVCALVP